MAGSIKGIIVEIGGDTSGLQKALSKVNSATSSLSKELRGINSLLKLDPSNTVLVSQKQKVLAENIETTSKKLEELKKAQELAAETILQGGEVSQENYRALQREIEVTQIKLNSLKAEVSKWNTAGDAMVDFGNKVSAISGKIDKLGTTLTTGLTLPIVALTGALINSSKEFETAFTGVEKTVDGTAEQMEELKQGIKNMAEEMPSSTTEIAAVAEAAGQLGIQTDSILEFTKTMINMGNATNLSSEEAATTLARFANVTQMSQSDFSKLGSVVVALGNNFATTEAEIANMGMNLASAGTQVGMSQSEIMALATALSSVGLEAQAGGTAFSKVMVNMQLAVEKGGKNLKDFASVAGMTTKDFKKAFKEDATTAIMKFVEGLSKSDERGKSAIKVLDDMGITETRLRDALLRSANASDVMNKAIDVGNKAWDENMALTDEANKRYQTLDSRLKMTSNKIKNVATNTGDKLTPTFNELLDKVDGLIDKFDDLSEEEINNIIKTGALVAATGPAIKILGTLGKTTGTTITTIGNFSKAIANVKNGVKVAEGQIGTFTKILGAMTSPIGLTITTLTALSTAIVIAMKNAEKESKQAFSNIGNGASDFINGIDNAKSHLSDFNSTLFVSSEEQQKLQEQMDDVQKGITNICKTASDERRGYTEKEIKQLDEYFAKLRDLNQKEIEIQQAISGAITQQATTNAQTFQGSLEEYKTQSQEWLKTAEEQKNKTIGLIEQQSIEEVALLNQRYGEQANMQNQSYATEYNNIIAQKQTKIDAANSEVAEVAQVYANGYLERSKQNSGFYTVLSQYDSQIESENDRHNQKIQAIEDGQFNWILGKRKDTRMENEKHNSEMKSIWDEMYKNMSDEQEKELGVWLANVAQTELYGGQIDDETQNIVDSILDSYESMPKGTQEAMKNAMEPMLTEMESAEPGLFAKASGIANGILSRLKTAFDINSPSRKTRQIFNFVMKGAELGLDDEEKNIYKQIDNFTKGMIGRLETITNFEKMANNLDLSNYQTHLNNKIIDSTKTVFTTPQIVFNVQELDDAKLQQCFNYVNRKFGSSY